MHQSDDIPIDAIRAAARRPEAVAAVEQLYREIDADIAARSPTCWNKGECCRFGEYGHRLYVTTLEVAYYLANRTSDVSRPTPHVTGPTSLPVLQSSGAAPDFGERSQDASRPKPNPALAADTCPHAHDGRCNVRTARPLGCRIFYCDPAAQDWQGLLTERYLQRLRDLHDTLAVPYIYADWMTILSALRPPLTSR